MLDPGTKISDAPIVAKKMQVANILQTLNRFAPPALAEDWDNVGLQVGYLEEDLTGVLVSLDVTEAVLWEAVEHNANCLVTHHPLFFQAFKSLDDRQVPTRLARLATQMGVNILSFHTNLDATQSGLNDQLASKLGMTRLKPLLPAADPRFAKAGLGRLGRVPKTSLKSFLKSCAKKLNVDHLRYVGDPRHSIEWVAVMTGSGGGFFNEAREAGADVLLTGDVKYHHALDALSQGIPLIDIGHFAGEIHMVPLVAEKIASYLKTQKSKIKVFTTSVQEDPFNFWP